MLIPREQIEALNIFIENIKDKDIGIKLQYKFLKIKSAIKEEAEIYQEQLFSNCKEFFEIDDNGNYKVTEQGGYKIKPEKITECNKKLYELGKVQIQIPDIYLSLDELETLNLNMNELEVLMPFIQE